MPVIKITQGSIESLQCTGATKTDYFDSRTKGLMIQVRSSGRKTYYYRERSADGKTRQTKIGDAETIRLAMVRRLVEERKKQQLQIQLNRVSQAWGIEAGEPLGDSPSASSAQSGYLIRFRPIQAGINANSARLMIFAIRNG